MKQNETIGSKIVALRKMKGVTQSDIGAYLNVSYQAVSKWERGESYPDFETLSRIARFFNVPISYFEDFPNEEPVIDETAFAEAQKEIPFGHKMLGVCKTCGKVVYEGEEGETNPVLVCKICTERKRLIEIAKAEEIKRQKEREKEATRLAKLRKDEENRKRRNRGLIWGGIIAAVLLVCIYIFDFSRMKSKTQFFEILLGDGLLGVMLFTFVSQMFWNGAVYKFASAGGLLIGTPGVIFSLDVDGVLFLIGVKLLFAVLKFIIFILSYIVLGFIAFLFSPITFIPALLRANKGNFED